jgi:hypothetical protein
MSGTLRTVGEAHKTATELKHLASAHHKFQTKLCMNIKLFLVYRVEDLFF